MAASFIGCLCATILAEPSPVMTRNSELMNPNTAATRILFLANTTSLFFRRNQAETPIMKTPAKTKPDEIVWRNLLMAIGERNTSQKLTISFRAVSGLNFIPTGFCIHELATRIHNADKLAPIAVSHVEVR